MPASNPTRDLGLPAAAVTRLRVQLPAVAEDAVAAIIVEVPAYSGALAGPMGDTIRNAVQLALGGFLSMAARSRGTDPGTPLAPALEAAYGLGRGEARSGRSMEALLAAYRVGARVSWRELSATAVAAGVPAATVAQFAELVFAYIDELSAASVAGHTDELATTGWVRQQYLQRLAQSLLGGDLADELASRAGRAGWDPPARLAAVLLPAEQAQSVLRSFDSRTLRADEDVPDLTEQEAGDLVVLLVPDAVGPGRVALARRLSGRQATIGPATPWVDVRGSFLRALRAHRGLARTADEALDTEQHLPALVLTADPSAVADLRRQVLAPFDDLPPATAARLRQTLREWLLHHGRRDDVAVALSVHPQTVRYRMGQVRALYGERLDDPDTVLALVVALGTDTPL